MVFTPHWPSNCIDIFRIDKIFIYLQKLDLSNNQLLIVEMFAMQHLKNLVELKISGNHLESLQAETFIGLSRLHSLNLSFNRLKSVHLMVFKHSPFLEVLNLNNNHIHEVSYFNSIRFIQFFLKILNNLLILPVFHFLWIFLWIFYEFLLIIIRWNLHDKSRYVKLF